jgi:hypothetical protein
MGVTTRTTMSIELNSVMCRPINYMMITALRSKDVVAQVYYKDKYCVVTVIKTV